MKLQHKSRRGKKSKRLSVRKTIDEGDEYTSLPASDEVSDEEEEEAFEPMQGSRAVSGRAVNVAGVEEAERLVVSSASLAAARRGGGGGGAGAGVDGGGEHRDHGHEHARSLMARRTKNNAQWFPGGMPEEHHGRGHLHRMPGQLQSGDEEQEAAGRDLMRTRSPHPVPASVYGAPAAQVDSISDVGAAVMAQDSLPASAFRAATANPADTTMSEFERGDHVDGLSDDGAADAEGIAQLKVIRRGAKRLGRDDQAVLRQKHKERRRLRLRKVQGTVYSYCSCESFQVRPLLKFLRDAGVKPRQFNDVAYVRLAGGRADAFVFFYGCVVVWSMDEDEQMVLQFLSSIKPFMQREYENMEEDDFDFTFGKHSEIHNDEITLSTNELIERLAVSFALAQSVKLSVYEDRVERQIEQHLHLPRELAETGHISLSTTEVSQHLGRLFMERSDINLTSDILDTPEFFWENDTHLKFFKSVSNYLEVKSRVGILNRRLDVVQELLDILRSEVDNRHASKLEIIIIWLIVVEVVVEVVWNIIVKDIFNQFNEVTLE